MGISIVRIREILDEDAYDDFNEFMKGQTIEFDKHGKSVIFEDDFLRWIKKLPIID